MWNSSMSSSLDSFSSFTVESKSRRLLNLNPEVFITLEFELVQSWTLIVTKLQTIQELLKY